MLLVVGGEVLDGGTHVFALDTGDVGCGHFTGEIGILTHIFETASVEGATGYGGARTEEDVLLAIGKLLADLVAV